ncbi:MAG TPA: hypothetical protein VFB04_14930 [Terriglobales bacterium]|nr:hypothetical protein [Terriglobales bacterium]
MRSKYDQKWIEKKIANRLAVSALAVVLLFGSSMKAQNAGMEKTLNITVHVLDGRTGKPMSDQHVLVFTGLSSDAVKTHAQHTSVTTDKDGVGMLTIYPAETQWLQVFADSRVLCYPNPNQSTFSVSDILSKGLVTSNDCSALVREPSPGHFIIFARPSRFMEKMKQ